MRNIALTQLVPALALVAALAVPCTFAKASQSTPPASAPELLAQAPGGQGHALTAAKARSAAEFHPIIREAIWLVEHTQNLLEMEAQHDFAGHRELAIQHLHQALNELHECQKVGK